MPLDAFKLLRVQELFNCFIFVSAPGDVGPARHGGSSGVPHRGSGARGQHRVQRRESGPPGHPGSETLRQREAPQQWTRGHGGLRMLEVRETVLSNFIDTHACLRAARLTDGLLVV